MLKRMVLDIESVDEKSRGLYEQRADGKWHIMVEPDDNVQALKDALEKERAANKKYAAELKNKESIDPTRYQEMEKKLTEIQEQKHIAENDIEAVVNGRTERMRAEYGAQVEKLSLTVEETQKKNKALIEQLGVAMVEKAIIEAVPSVGRLKPGAQKFLLQEARSTWRLDDEGNHRAYKQDGTPMFSADGRSSLSHKEWLEMVAKDNSFLFEGSSGGGGGMPSSAQQKGATIAPELQNASGAAKIAFGLRGGGV